jgi:hypothetical protein
MGIHISNIRRIKPVERMDTSASNNTVFDLLDTNPLVIEEVVDFSNAAIESNSNAPERSLESVSKISHSNVEPFIGREFGIQTDEEIPTDSIEELKETIETLQSQFQALMMENTTLDTQNRHMKDELEILKRQRNVLIIDLGMEYKIRGIKTSATAFYCRAFPSHRPQRVLAVSNSHSRNSSPANGYQIASSQLGLEEQSGT